MSLDRINDRLDEINDKIHNNHVETLKAISGLEKSVTKHEQNFSILRWITPPGAILGIIAWIKITFFGS